MEPKLGVIVADIRIIIPFELNLLFNGWFGVVLSQIFYIVVNQLSMMSFIPHPTEQFGLFEVCCVSLLILRIHCGAPFIVHLQVNQPYFFISIVVYHNLLRTDHINLNILQIVTFHFLPKQYLSVAVSVEKNNFCLLII